MPKVSVIIPVCNTEKYLRKCLDSVCNQTLSDIEIICINDCSLDNSLSILNEYASKDNRIKIIDLKNNKGVSFARNTGIAQAQSEYIGFVDSDDFIDLDFYEKLYKKAKEIGADAVKGNMRLVCSPKNAEKESFYDINNDIKQNVGYFYHSFTSAIYNLNFLKNNDICFPKNLNNFEDPYFSIKAAVYYKNFSVLNNTYYYYVENEQSLSKQINDIQIINLFDSVYQIINFINSATVDKKHYCIVYSFLLKILNPYFLNQNLSVVINEKFLNLFAYFIQECKYKNEVINFYFYSLKKHENKKRLRELLHNIKGDTK